MAYIVTDGRDEEGEGVERLEQTGDGRLGSSGTWCVAWWIVWQDAELEEKVEDGLKDIDDMAEIVVENKLIVSMSAGEKEGFDVG